jgi:hypothetical protein
MQNLARRIARLEAEAVERANGVELCVYLYEGETHEEAIAHAYPDGPPPHGHMVLLRTFTPRHPGAFSRICPHGPYGPLQGQTCNCWSGASRASSSH